MAHKKNHQQFIWSVLAIFSILLTSNIIIINAQNQNNTTITRAGVSSGSGPGAIESEDSSIDTLVKDAFSDRPTTTQRPTSVISTNENSNNNNNTNQPSSIESNLVFSGVLPRAMRNESREQILQVVRQAHQNLLDPVIVTNKTSAFLSCETGEMIVKMNFTEPFSGVVYADYDRSSPCRIFGDSSKYYELRLPLKGCGTRQEAPRLFINNIIVRFHRSLELEEDEIKTIVCRYPPPQAPPPRPPPRGPPEKIVEVPPEPAKLVRYEPLFMIAGLLFFTLLLLGFGVGSYAVKKRIITPVHVLKPAPPVNYFDDTYLDTQSIVDQQDLTTLHKQTHMFAPPLPRLDTQIVSETFVTTLHEIDTIDTTINNKSKQLLIPKPPLDMCIADDAYITQQDEIDEEDLQTNHRKTIMMAPKRVPKVEIKNIEETFITNLHEIETETHETQEQQQQQFIDQLAFENYQQEQEEQEKIDRQLHTKRYEYSTNLNKDNLETTTKEYFEHEHEHEHNDGEYDSNDYNNRRHNDYNDYLRTYTEQSTNYDTDDEQRFNSSTSKYPQQHHESLGHSTEFEHSHSLQRTINHDDNYHDHDHDHGYQQQQLYSLERSELSRGLDNSLENLSHRNDHDVRNNYMDQYEQQHGSNLNRDGYKY